MSEGILRTLLLQRARKIALVQVKTSGTAAGINQAKQPSRVKAWLLLLEQINRRFHAAQKLSSLLFAPHARIRIATQEVRRRRRSRREMEKVPRSRLPFPLQLLAAQLHPLREGAEPMPEHGLSDRPRDGQEELVILEHRAGADIGVQPSAHCVLLNGAWRWRKRIDAADAEGVNDRRDFHRTEEEDSEDSLPSADLSFDHHVVQDSSPSRSVRLARSSEQGRHQHNRLACSPSQGAVAVSSSPGRRSPACFFGKSVRRLQACRTSLLAAVCAGRSSGDTHIAARPQHRRGLPSKRFGRRREPPARAALGAAQRHARKSLLTLCSAQHTQARLLGCGKRPQSLLGGLGLRGRAPQPARMRAAHQAPPRHWHPSGGQRAPASRAGQCELGRPWPSSGWSRLRTVARGQQSGLAIRWIARTFPRTMPSLGSTRPTSIGVRRDFPDVLRHSFLRPSATACLLSSSPGGACSILAPHGSCAGIVVASTSAAASALQDLLQAPHRPECGSAGQLGNRWVPACSGRCAPLCNCVEFHLLGWTPRRFPSGNPPPLPLLCP
eukprot:scaffold442_cov268-Pinguiococcus_pyrenoidosus.AAC.86